jgi:hypothetical protein
LTHLVSPRPVSPDAPTHAISLVPFFQVPLALSHSRRPSRGALPLSKAGAKIRPFSKPPKFFFTFFTILLRTRCATATKKTNFFFTAHGKAPAKLPAATLFFSKSGVRRPGKITLLVQNIIIQYFKLKSIPNRPIVPFSIVCYLYYIYTLVILQLYYI